MLKTLNWKQMVLWDIETLTSKNRQNLVKRTFNWPITILKNIQTTQNFYTLLEKTMLKPGNVKHFLWKITIKLWNQ